MHHVYICLQVSCSELNYIYYKAEEREEEELCSVMWLRVYVMTIPWQTLDLIKVSIVPLWQRRTFLRR